MARLRSLSTSFWSDPFIEDLTPSEKLLFIYLITNEKTNMLGIYESSIKKISFETGLNKETVIKALKGFETVGKVKYINNYVVLVNFMKHQNFNTNMKKSAIDVYNYLPKELKASGLVVSKDKPLKGFESLLNHFGMISKVEVEEKVEEEYKEEDETETKNKRKEEFDLFWDLYDSKKGRKNCFDKFKRLKQSEVDLILAKVKPYVISTPDVKYRKNPLTWLRGEHWNDEIKPKKQSYKPQKPTF